MFVIVSAQPVVISTGDRVHRRQSCVVHSRGWNFVHTGADGVLVAHVPADWQQAHHSPRPPLPNRTTFVLRFRQKRLVGF